MTIVIDIGGEGNLANRTTMSVKPYHPIWGQATWFTVNIAPEKAPDIVSDAVTVERVRENSVDGIYSSHTIEHIDPTQSTEMFRNWYRVLKPGGRLEIRCPDVEWTWKERFEGRLPEAIIGELLLGIRVGPYEAHRNLWWESKLISELQSQGFVHARRINYGFIRPALDFWLYDGRYTEYHGFKVIDLVVEAFKPPVDTASAATDRDRTTERMALIASVRRLVSHRAPHRVLSFARRLRDWRQRSEAQRLLHSILLLGNREGTKGKSWSSA